MSDNLFRILYVDDDADLREIGEFALSLHPDIEVRTAASGDEALQLIDAGRWRPDGLLLDVMMPVMDGPTLLGEIRRRTTCEIIPAVFITARGKDDRSDLLQETSAVAVLAKPFDPLTLGQRLHDLMRAA